MPTHDFYNVDFSKLWMSCDDSVTLTIPADFVVPMKDDKKRKSYVMPSVTKVTHTKDGATVVFYDDGTKSWVRPAEGTEPDPFVGFCMAVMKRLYGSTTNMIKDYEKHLTGGGANGCKKGKHDK